MPETKRPDITEIKKQLMHICRIAMLMDFTFLMIPGLVIFPFVLDPRTRRSELFATFAIVIAVIAIILAVYYIIKADLLCVRIKAITYDTHGHMSEHGYESALMQLHNIITNISVPEKHGGKEVKEYQEQIEAYLKEKGDDEFCALTQKK